MEQNVSEPSIVLDRVRNCEIMILDLAAFIEDMLATLPEQTQAMPNVQRRRTKMELIRSAMLAP